MALAKAIDYPFQNELQLERVKKVARTHRQTHRSTLLQATGFRVFSLSPLEQQQTTSHAPPVRFADNKRSHGRQASLTPHLSSLSILWIRLTKTIRAILAHLFLKSLSLPRLRSWPNKPRRNRLMSSQSAHPLKRMLKALRHTIKFQMNRPLDLLGDQIIINKLSPVNSSSHLSRPRALTKQNPLLVRHSRCPAAIITGQTV